jgi:hypothetical protein
MPFRLKTVALLPLLLLLGLPVFAADAGTVPPSNTDGRYVSFDLGMVAGINIAANAARVGRTFGINFTLSDSMTAGIVSTTAGTNNYTLMKLAYFLTPALGLSVYVGTDVAGAAAPATGGGAGLFYNVVRSQPGTGLATALKLRLEYLFDTGAGLANGDVVLSVGSSIGL